MRQRQNPLLMTVMGNPASNPCHGGRHRRNPGFIPMVAGGIAGSLVTRAMSNPGGPQFIVIDAQDGTVMYTKRATGMGSGAITSCVEVARKLAARNRKSYIVFLDLNRMSRGSQVNVAMARVMGITEEIHPDGSSTRGNPARRRRRMQPNGSGTKRTIPIEKFAAMVKSQRDPALWRDFVAKCKAYHKWSHGTWPKRVTIESVRKPGVKGMWITFDMGREPEKTYVMPKGTKRKGAWKHPWERMPQLRGDAEAGFILTKLGKGNRLTDFLHG